jgi:hypothetical protein
MCIDVPKATCHTLVNIWMMLLKKLNEWRLIYLKNWIIYFLIGIGTILYGIYGLELFLQDFPHRYIIIERAICYIAGVIFIIMAVITKRENW